MTIAHINGIGTASFCLDRQVSIQSLFTEGEFIKHRIAPLIAIITCRRPDGLRKLLNTLIELDVKNYGAEILVVDNACEKQIEEIISDLASESPLPIHYQQEPVPGIVAARNKCVSWFLERDFDMLLFIDDDEWISDDQWLIKLVEAKSKYQADVVTSHVISVGESNTPEWAVKLIYGDNQLQEGQSLNKFYTNNLLIDRKVLERIQPAFDARFSMTGASDYHFALKCINEGFKANYTNAPVFEDFPLSRAKVSWFMKRGYRSGIGYSRSHLFEGQVVLVVLKCILLSIMRLGLGGISLFLGVIFLNKCRQVKGLFRLSSAYGTLAGLFGARHEEYKSVHEI